MTLERTRLRLDREVASADLRELIERAYRRLNQLTETVGALVDGVELARAATAASNYNPGWQTGNAAAVSGNARLVNRAGVALAPGEVLGTAGSGIVKAQAGVVRPLMVATVAAGIGQPIAYSTAGVHYLLVEAGTNPAEGDAAWLSATHAGRVTPVAPQARFLVGQFLGAKNSATGQALVALHLDLAQAR